MQINKKFIIIKVEKLLSKHTGISRTKGQRQYFGGQSH
jgi:hypothetical protein